MQLQQLRLPQQGARDYRAATAWNADGVELGEQAARAHVRSSFGMP
jgi:hypothetical protein